MCWGMQPVCPVCSAWDSSTEECSPLHCAADKFHVEVLKTLLASGGHGLLELCQPPGTHADFGQLGILPGFSLNQRRKV